MKHFEKFFLVLMVVFLCVSSLFAQPPDTLWTRVYGGEHDDCIYDVIETSDSEYVAVGSTRSFGAGNSDVYLIKLNTNGDTMWTKTYGGPLDDVGRSVQETSDGGFIIAGWTESFATDGSNIYLIKTDINGDTTWTNTSGGTLYDYGYSVQETSDNGFILAGRISSFSVGGSDVFLTKTDSLGNTLWSKIYGSTGWDAGCSIRKTSDGGFVIAGRTTSNGPGWDVYIIRIDTNGDSLWTKTYGGTNWDVGYELQETFDGGYIITGCTDSYGAGGFDIYLAKIDSLGNMVWSRTQGGIGWDEGRSIQETADKGFIIAGSTESFGAGGFDLYLVRTYSNGYPIWTETYGGTDWDIGYSVKLTSDGGYIIAGKTKSFGAGLYDAYIIKTKPDLGIEEEKSIGFPFALQISPNPFTENVNIKYGIGQTAEPIELGIYDVTGRNICALVTNGIYSGPQTVVWNGNNNVGEKVSGGIYFLKIKSGKHTAVRKLILIK